MALANASAGTCGPWHHGRLADMGDLEAHLKKEPTMDKNTGRIAYEAFCNGFTYAEDALPEELETRWKNAANAVLEEAARLLRACAELEDIARSWRTYYGGVSVSPKTLASREAAEFLRTLKS
jgi:hypothetical protein